MFTNLLGNIAISLKSERFAYNESKKFTIQGTPDTDSIVLFIVNGVIYFDDADVSYDKKTKTFAWKSDIELSESDCIMALYCENM